jgi:hypothetical protein
MQLPKDRYKLGLYCATTVVFLYILPFIIAFLRINFGESPLAGVLFIVWFAALHLLLLAILAMTLLIIAKESVWRGITLAIVFMFVASPTIFMDVLLLFSRPTGGPTPDICMFQVGLQCSEFRLDASNDTVDLTIVNGYMQTINITNVSCQEHGDPTTWTNPNVVVLAQKSQKLNAQLFDVEGTKLYFEPGDTFTGKCVVVYYFTSEGPSMSRRNTADVKFTAQP